MHQVVPGIVRISRVGSLMNCYLVVEQDDITVVDTLFAGTAPEILAAAKTLGKPIRRILLTHAHADHIGGLDRLAQNLQGADVAIGRRESRIMGRRSFALDPDEPQTKIKGMYPSVATSPVTRLDEGDFYGSLEVIATPGHTPGHMSYLHRPTGMLFAGDAVVSVPRLRAVYDCPWYFPFGNFATWHRPTALTSMRKLATLDLDGVLPGHGAPVLEDVPGAFQQAFARIHA